MLISKLFVLCVFRAAVDGIEYKFTFNLYELIKPEQCKVRVLGSEVHLGLTKATKGRWPALLKGKEKVEQKLKRTSSE